MKVQLLLAMVLIGNTACLAPPTTIDNAGSETGSQDRSEITSGDPSVVIDSTQSEQTNAYIVTQGATNLATDFLVNETYPGTNELSQLWSCKTNSKPVVRYRLGFKDGGNGEMIPRNAASSGLVWAGLANEAVYIKLLSSSDAYVWQNFTYTGAFNFTVDKFVDRRLVEQHSCVLTNIDGSSVSDGTFN